MSPSRRRDDLEMRLDRRGSNDDDVSWVEDVVAEEADERDGGGVMTAFVSEERKRTFLRFSASEEVAMLAGVV